MIEESTAGVKAFVIFTNPFVGGVTVVMEAVPQVSM